MSTEKQSLAVSLVFTDSNHLTLGMYKYAKWPRTTLIASISNKKWRQATLHHEPCGPGLCQVDSVVVEEMSNNDECNSASSEVLRR